MDAARAKRIVSLVQDFWPVELPDMGETPDLEKIRAMTVLELVYHWGATARTYNAIMRGKYKKVLAEKMTACGYEDAAEFVHSCIDTRSVK
jgi:hypothetical protein